MPRRLLGAVVATAMLGLTAVGSPAAHGGAPPPARETPRTQEPGEDDGPSVRGLGQEAPWITRDGTWTIDLAVEGAPPGGSVRGAIYARFEDREQFNRALFDVVEGERKAGIPSVDLDAAPAAPGGGRRVRLAVTLNSEQQNIPGWAFLERGLAPGVYPVQIEVVDADDETLSSTVTFLARVPSDGEDDTDRPPLLVAPVLPVSASPSVGADGASEMPRGLVDQVISVSNGLTFAEDLPLTLVPRPETIEALDREPEGAAALAALREAARTRQVVDGPYVEVPVAAWIDRGLQEELERQRVRGNGVLTGRLGRADSSTWLAVEDFSPAAAAALWPVGVRSVIVAPEAIDAADGPAMGPVTISAGPNRSLDAIAPDPGLSGALTRKGDPILDEASLVAELALVASLGDSQRGVVMMPSPQWPVDSAAVGRLAAILLAPDAPVRPVTVGGLLDTIGTRSPGTLIPTVPIDLGGHPGRLLRARSLLASYESLTGPGHEEIVALDQRLLLSGSSTLSPRAQREYVESVLATVDARLSSVAAPGRQTITLTSSEGAVPLTLRSQLEEPVDVVIELESDRRVDFPDGARIVRRVVPGDNRIALPVRARVPGDSPIDITIRTPDGTVKLDEVRYTVRSTAISGLGVVLSAGAAAFLVLWWARHWTRSRRARREEAAARGRRAAESMVGADANAEGRT